MFLFQISAQGAQHGQTAQGVLAQEQTSMRKDEFNAPNSYSNRLYNLSDDLLRLKNPNQKELNQMKVEVVELRKHYQMHERKDVDAIVRLLLSIEDNISRGNMPMLKQAAAELKGVQVLGELESVFKDPSKIGADPKKLAALRSYGAEIADLSKYLPLGLKEKAEGFASWVGAQYTNYSSKWNEWYVQNPKSNNVEAEKFRKRSTDGKAKGAFGIMYSSMKKEIMSSTEMPTSELQRRVDRIYASAEASDKMLKDGINRFDSGDNILNSNWFDLLKNAGQFSVGNIMGIGSEKLRDVYKTVNECDAKYKAFKQSYLEFKDALKSGDSAKLSESLGKLSQAYIELSYSQTNLAFKIEDYDLKGFEYVMPALSKSMDVMMAVSLATGVGAVATLGRAGLKAAMKEAGTYMLEKGTQNSLKMTFAFFVPETISEAISTSNLAEAEQMAQKNQVKGLQALSSILQNTMNSSKGAQSAAQMDQLINRINTTVEDLEVKLQSNPGYKFDPIKLQGLFLESYGQMLLFEMGFGMLRGAKAISSKRTGRATAEAKVEQQHKIESNAQAPVTKKITRLEPAKSKGVVTLLSKRETALKPEETKPTQKEIDGPTTGFEGVVKANEYASKAAKLVKEAQNETNNQKRNLLLDSAEKNYEMAMYKFEFMGDYETAGRIASNASQALPFPESKAKFYAHQAQYSELNGDLGQAGNNYEFAADVSNNFNFKQEYLKKAADAYKESGEPLNQNRVVSKSKTLTENRDYEIKKMAIQAYRYDPVWLDHAEDFAKHQIKILKGKKSNLDPEIVEFFKQSGVLKPLEGLTKEQQIDFFESLKKSNGLESIFLNPGLPIAKAAKKIKMNKVADFFGGEKNYNYSETFYNLLILEAERPGAFETLYNENKIRHLHRYDVQTELLPQYTNVTSKQSMQQTVAYFAPVADHSNAFRSSPVIDVAKGQPDIKIIRYEIKDWRELRASYSDFLKKYPGSSMMIIGGHGDGFIMQLGFNATLTPKNIRKAFDGLHPDKPVDLVLESCSMGANAKPFIKFSSWWLPPIPNPLYLMPRLAPAASKIPFIRQVHAATKVSYGNGNIQINEGGTASVFYRGKPLKNGNRKENPTAVFENGKYMTKYSANNE